MPWNVKKTSLQKLISTPFFVVNNNNEITVNENSSTNNDNSIFNSTNNDSNNTNIVNNNNNSNIINTNNTTTPINWKLFDPKYITSDFMNQMSNSNNNSNIINNNNNSNIINNSTESTIKSIFPISKHSSEDEYSTDNSTEDSSDNSSEDLNDIKYINKYVNNNNCSFIPILNFDLNTKPQLSVDQIRNINSLLQSTKNKTECSICSTTVKKQDLTKHIKKCYKLSKYRCKCNFITN